MLPYASSRMILLDMSLVFALSCFLWYNKANRRGQGVSGLQITGSWVRLRPMSGTLVIMCGGPELAKQMCKYGQYVP